VTATTPCWRPERWRRQSLWQDWNKWPADSGPLLKLTSRSSGKWAQTVLHNFDGTDGDNAHAGVVFDTEPHYCGGLGLSTESPSGGTSIGIVAGCFFL
jgi:hypothetical protein